MRGYSPWWIDSNVCFPRLTAARMRFGRAVHRKGFSIPRRHEHVADAPHSADGLRPSRIDLDLAAQPCNPQIDRPIERLHLSVRGDLEQPIPVQRAIGVLGKNSEKIIFARSERFLAAVARIDKDALL